MNNLAGTKIPAGPGYATVLPDFDFECYSEAGYYWSPEANRWKGVTKTGPGLPAVGAAVYAEHPSTVVLSLAYDLKDGRGDRLWLPGDPPPTDLFQHITAGRLLEAWNSSFEHLIWLFVCQRRMGWPVLPPGQLRCAMAKARAHSLPGKLGEAAKVLNAPEQKDPAGDLLIRKLCVPQQPTKNRAAGRCTDPALLQKLYGYNRQDIKAEASASQLCPDLSPSELQLWLLDQQINFRGVHIDRKALNDCIYIVQQAAARGERDLRELTNGAVQTAGELAKIIAWLGTQGVRMKSLDADAVDAALELTNLPPSVRRVLEIRSSLGAASVKKLFAIDRRVSADGRLKDLFAFCGADRTGRWAGRGPQPQNLPSSGPKVVRCKSCGTIRWKESSMCDCFATEAEPTDWGADAVEAALTDIATGNLDWVILRWGDPIAAVSGCLRGLFTAAPGHDLLCSDFSAIEAVVLAELAGEEWRQEVFRTHGKIYEMSAAKISGVPFEDFLRHKKETGQHHPLRKKVGKVAELACFGADTLVLTDSGWKRIADIRQHDWIHDGVGFVASDGAVSRGERVTLALAGVTVTPDHKFYVEFMSESGWHTAEDVYVNPTVRIKVVATAVRLLNSKSLFLNHCLPTPRTARREPHEPMQEVFDILNCGPRSRFVVLTDDGPMIAHNSGYGGGLGAWKAFGADAFMSDEEIVANVKVWRAASPAIARSDWNAESRCAQSPGFWYGIQQAAYLAVQSPGHCYSFQAPANRFGQPPAIIFGVKDDILYCRLPSGRNLTYHQPRLQQKTLPWGAQTTCLTYMGWNSNYLNGPVGWMRLETYGPKLTENCIARGTEVLTERGWVEIQCILPPDRVHDGIEFVDYGTLVFKSVQECVTVDSVWMTPDHEVLTDEGWKTAEQKPKPYRPVIRDAHGDSSAPQRRKKTIVDFPMRLREYLRKTWRPRGKRINEPGGNTQLRVLNKTTPVKAPNDTRYEQTPRLRCVAVHERPVPPTIASSVGELRSAGCNGVPRVAGLLRGILGGYGANVPFRVILGEIGQFGRVWTWKLRMERRLCPSEQSPLEHSYQHTVGGAYDSGSLPSVGGEEDHVALSVENELAPGGPVQTRRLEVYDIVNCGPRQRFVVRGADGPFIVHNCVQAVSRDLLAYAMMGLDAAGYPIVLHVHDEIVAEVPAGAGDIGEFEKIMGTMPSWASGWPIRAAGGWRGLRYRKE